jgi:tRNA-splicing ligase RtcB (3'-phosphate/5'-hydroxy nucleic acid ligase)
MLKRVSPTTCIIPAEGAMLVPGKVYLSEALEAQATDGSLQQVAQVAALPGIVKESIAMPDMHIGYGFPIGGVAAFDSEEGIISPGGIGFDINCGVRVLVTDLHVQQVQPLIEELIDVMHKAVPTGNGRDSSIRLDHAQLESVLMQGSQWALKHGYATPQDIETTEEHGVLKDADYHAVSSRAKDRGVNQLGTLGAGNHFLEVQVVQKILDAEKARVYGLHEGQVIIMIHCGSRGVGHQVCTDYLKAMEEAFPEIASSLPERNLMYAPIQSELAKQYYKAMAAAANYAWANRQVIAHHVRASFQRLFPGCTVTQLYDVSHNIAKKEVHEVDGVQRELYVHRKGATRSFGPGRIEVCAQYRAVGQPVLIPGSMGTASYILAGAPGAMEETFGSSCHGAGRQLSRTKALETLKGEQVRRSLKDHGVYVKASGKGLAEEAPQAYKDVDEVIRVVAEAGIAVPVARCTPLGVLKG